MWLKGQNAVIYAAAGRGGPAVSEVVAKETARVFVAGRTPGLREDLAKGDPVRVVCEVP